MFCGVFGRVKSKQSKQKKVQNLSTASVKTKSTILSAASSGNGAKPSQLHKTSTVFDGRRLEAKAALGGKVSIQDRSLLSTAKELQQESLSSKINDGSLVNVSINNSRSLTSTENDQNANCSNLVTIKNNNSVATILPQSNTPSPVLNHHGKKVTNTATLENKIPLRLQSSAQKRLHRQHHSIEDAAVSNSLRPSDLLNPKHLYRHSYHGCLDYESLEQQLQFTAETQKNQHKAIEAMGALLQYLIFDLDALACPVIKNESRRTKECLSLTQQLLSETKSACTKLQDQLCDKEAYYTQREEELRALHRSELEKVQKSFSKMQLDTESEISSLKGKLKKNLLDAESRETIMREKITYLEKKELEFNEHSFDNYRIEMEKKIATTQLALKNSEESKEVLQNRIACLEKSEEVHRKKAQAIDSDVAQRLLAANQRENELLENLKATSKELSILKESKNNRERELNDKLILTKDEIAILRSSSHLSMNESIERNNSQRNSNSASVGSVEILRLQSEAESLRCVLELKQKENSKLAKQNEELIRDADERAALQAKISRLESDHEMLQSEIEIKSEKEKELLRQIDTLQKAYEHESIKRKSLSFDKEALQYKLKQRSEQLHLVEAKLQELSSHDLQYSSLGSLGHSNINDSSLLMHSHGDVSPPSSPVDKRMIEKTNSVSWVLEMDNDTPETAASKMVKRAGSFRSVERIPSTRRQLSFSANTATDSNAFNTSNDEAPIPLSQSMSATSVIRQHSHETVETLGRVNSRIRSKSVSVKSSEPATGSKKKLRQTSNSSLRKTELVPPVWKDPTGSSPPFCGNLRPRCSTLQKKETTEAGEEELFRRSSSKLITCDTSSLNTGLRLEMRVLPTHPSMHDLKTQKKCHEIQESAGEAMVSGTNSEDEGCSASSDEVVSSSASTTSSTSSGSSSSLNQEKDHHISLEDEVLLLDKTSSLNGTPMEVSWSEEVEAYTSNGSTV